ncbi:hypothetical protein OPT61_g2798 [Boeremia exigua]|uniref:Uncharacterized protein n=1 Tax=Boeremia exigua TaxID=749465 RepID=A0ACC2IK64_9PLEO|nr:hypothetical protein OPT61_g2798 [Boeremia exigua]
MPPIRMGPKDLLEYDANYGVIICRKCHYAIQKSALQSHLLRHKIFRHERHSLLASIAQLTILEPNDVPLPLPTSKPIDALPTIPGLRCTVEKCDSLYASVKRMKRHQIEVHNTSSADPSGFLVRSVTLQTFFRGTKIRYFEVASVDRATVSDPEPVPESPGRTTVVEDDVVQHEGQHGLQTGAITMPVLSPTSTSGSAEFNLQSLVYFNHFISETSSTIPPSEPKQPLYWHTEFVSQALQQKWLMAGLLALSASHMGALAHKSSAAIAHYDRSVELWKDFEDGRKAHTQDNFNTSRRGTPTPHKGILEQISSMMKCAHTTFSIRTSGRQVTLERLITSMRSLVTGDTVIRPCDLNHDEDDAFGRAARLLEMTNHDTVLAAFLGRLNTLPNRMAEALGRPNDLRDVMTALSAIATLIESCVAGFEASEVSFWVMATWLSRAADEFHQMLAENKQAALIVLAHWAASLVRSVEDDGCWFLDGAAEFILAEVREKLQPNGPATRSLIEDLEGAVYKNGNWKRKEGYAATFYAHELSPQD